MAQINEDLEEESKKSKAIDYDDGGEGFNESYRSGRDSSEDSSSIEGDEDNEFKIYQVIQ